MDPILAPLTAIKALIADFAVLDVAQIRPADTLGDLGLDSLDLIQLVLEIEVPEARHPETSTRISEIHDLIQTLQAA
jgi:hypothetical protein